MTDWTKFFGTNAGLPPASEPMQSLRVFGPGVPALDREGVQSQDDTWRIEVKEQGFLARLFKRPRSVRLFEVDNPGVEHSLLVYRAKMKTEGPIGRAYLEMWCRMSGREYFSKGHAFGPVASGATDWNIYETPFLLQKGQAPSLLRLNVAVEGTGTVLVKDVELLVSPLRGSVSPPPQ
jgi:hypothetical protein